MSFLEQSETDAESDSSATLQQVLAFIDACDAEAVDEAPRVRGKRGRPKQTNAVRPHSYRVRDQVQRLRRDAEQLETRLAQLKNGTGHHYELQLVLLQALNVSAHASKRSIETVLLEYRRRQESECTNRQLKALLTKQMRLIRASEAAFGVFTNAEISLVFNSQRVAADQNSSMDELHIMASLEDRLTKLELDVDHVVSSNDAGSVSMQCNNNSYGLGISREYSSCSSIPFSVELAEAMLMQVYARKMAKRKAIALDANLSDVRITKTKQFQHEQERYELFVKGRMRKSNQADRVVFVMSSLVFLPSERLTCTEESIVVITALDCASTACGSHLTNWHRSHAQHNDVPTSLERERTLAALRQRFITESSDRNKHHMYKLKKWLREGKLESLQ